MSFFMNSSIFDDDYVPIIDQLSATAQSNLFDARSFYKLRADYTGFCVTIRRTSDGVELDIGFSGNYVDVDAINTFLGGGAGTIAKWYDQSGNGYDIFNTDATEQPNIANGQFAAHSALLVANFSAHSLYSVDLGAIIDQNTLDIYTVGYKDSTAYGAVFTATLALTNFGSSYTSCIHTATHARTYIGGQGVQVSFVLTNKAWWDRTYREGINQDVKGEIFKDGDVSNTLYNVANAVTESNVKYLLMGAERESAIASPYSGDILEDIHFNGHVLSAGDKTLLEDWQKLTYGIS